MNTETVRTILANGMQGTVVDIECSITNGLPSINLVGSISKNIDEAKDRVRSAYTNTGLTFPKRKITINLAPADIPKSGTSLDVGIAISILKADKKLDRIDTDGFIFIGELSLNGSIRGVRGVIGMILTVLSINRETTIVVPSENLDQAKTIPGARIMSASTLKDLLGKLENPNDHTIDTSMIIEDAALVKQTKSDPMPYLDIIAGQEQAKRALEVAAAGGHNILISGPPGSGKSMLAKALRDLLPALSKDETMEVNHINSLVNHNYHSLINTRPLRAPHHSAGYASITGGGQPPRPGEITLSHRGVLMLDELPEFPRKIIESLRQPLEDNKVTLSRGKYTLEFPADFILIATANPCPCGYYGVESRCTCSPSQIAKYNHKLSGPILDRIDIHIAVSAVKHSALLKDIGMSSFDDTRKRVSLARDAQFKRTGNKSTLNAGMDNEMIKNFSKLEPEAKSLLDAASEKIDLTARSYMKTIKVARTIADIEAQEKISVSHMSEALQYRQKLKSSY